MTITNDKTNGQGLFSIFRRKQPWREIFGYSVGDIREQQPVAIAAGATVVGNVYAPQIIVVGLLSGTAIGHEVTVQGEGQIWGDIYAVRLHVEPGGLIRGWINTVAESEYEALLNGRSQEIDIDSSHADSAPNGLKPEHHRLHSHDDLDTLRRLQAETAVALAARSELEKTFDERLAEIAGEATNQLATLREELRITKADQAKWEQQAQQIDKTLQQRETQLERQSKELSLTQETLAQTTFELEELRELFAQKEADLNQLTSAKLGVDTHLHEALLQVDTLTDRVHNIETALQASLVHSSDQEDALLRWQELAESTEQKVKTLETELMAARQQIEQSNDIINMQRDQRKQIEEEWTLAQIRIEDLQKELEQEIESSKQLLTQSDDTIKSLTDKNNQLQAQLEPLQTKNIALMRQMQMAKTKFLKQEEESSNLRKQYAELETNLQKAQAELEKISQQPTKLLSSEQIEQLRTELEAAKQETEGLQEQILWYQASLETSQSSLNQAKMLVVEQKAQLDQLKGDHEAARIQIGKWQQEVDFLKRRLQEQKGEQAGELKKLKEDLHQKKVQLNASEDDLRRHLQETAVQGQRLAEMQATLIERELQLQQAQQTIAKQQQFIKQMKQVTTQKLNSLETALAQARKS